jgi:hypothetical protein
VNHYVLLPDGRDVETFATAAQADLYAAAVGGKRMYTLEQLLDTYGKVWLDMFLDRFVSHERHVLGNVTFDRTAAKRILAKHDGLFHVIADPDGPALLTASYDELNFLPRKEPNK